MYIYIYEKIKAKLFSYIISLVAIYCISSIFTYKKNSFSVLNLNKKLITNKSKDTIGFLSHLYLYNYR